MAPKKASTSSEQLQEKETGGVKPFCPKLDGALMRSKLTKREMDKMVALDASLIDLDPCNPDKSLWLTGDLKSLQSEDPEKRFFTLCRITNVFTDVVKRENLEVIAGLSAYLLEHGILVEIARLLKAAQTSGDFYLISGYTEDPVEKLLVQREGGPFFLAKLQICVNLLDCLMADARTVRFIRKKIPDLISYLEGVYLAQYPVSNTEGAKMKLHASIEEDEKRSALCPLATLAARSSAQDKSLIASRKVLLRQMMRDAMDRDSMFSRRIINRVMLCTSYLIAFLPASLLEDYLKVAFKAMEISASTVVIEGALRNVANLWSDGKVTLSSYGHLERSS